VLRSRLSTTSSASCRRTGGWYRLGRQDAIDSSIEVIAFHPPGPDPARAWTGIGVTHGRAKFRGRGAASDRPRRRPSGVRTYETGTPFTKPEYFRQRFSQRVRRETRRTQRYRARVQAPSLITSSWTSRQSGARVFAKDAAPRLQRDGFCHLEGSVPDQQAGDAEAASEGGAELNTGDPYGRPCPTRLCHLLSRISPNMMDVRPWRILTDRSASQRRSVS